MRVHQQPCHVLLNRPYSETSWIVEIFSEDTGRLSLMAKGARRLKSKLKGELLPFQPLLLSWSGKGDMPTLTSTEIDRSRGLNSELRGEALVCAFYYNELLVNLLHRYDPHPKLYRQYVKTLSELGASSHELRANSLRQFEQALLKEAGYAVDFLTEAENQSLIKDDAYYYYQPGKGFLSTRPENPKAVIGEAIKSLHAVEHSDQAVSPQAKQLMRDIVQQVLGRKRIVSRDLFVQGQA